MKIITESVRRLIDEGNVTAQALDSLYEDVEKVISRQDEAEVKIDEHGQKIKVQGKAIAATKKDVQLMGSIVELDHGILDSMEVKYATPANLSPPRSPSSAGLGSRSSSLSNLKTISEEVAKLVLDGIKEILDVNTGDSGKQETIFVKNLAFDLKKYSKELLEASEASVEKKEELAGTLVRKLKCLFTVKDSAVKIDNSRLTDEGFLKTILEAVNNEVIIYAVISIEYDTPLLNHVGLLQDSIKRFGFNKTLNLSEKLDAGLISEAIANNDHTLILAGLMSLEHGDYV